ncbi:hypothetical protein BC940DRAFT_322388 [Gongronella butleri]|nr:hypothetical protein BC940DRAFT_322388 [Gongronella butleri]
MLTRVTVCTLLLLLCSLAVADEETLSVYHRKGSDYLRRGTIVGLPHYPKYVPDEHGQGDVSPGLYQVKIRNEKTGVLVQSAIPACQLLSSAFHDGFRVHLDQDQHVYHVEYYALNPACEPFTETRSTEEFNTNVVVVRPNSGAKPAIGNFQPQAKQEAAKQKTQSDQDEGMKEPEEEKSFIQKYWYLLLAGAFLLMSNAAPPPEEQGAPQRGAGAARR